MAAAFGEVTYQQDQSVGSGQPASADPNSTNATSTSNVELIDPNDPRLTSETIADDATADAYAVTPPLPDGKWRAKLKQVDIKDPKGQLQRYIATMAHWKQPAVPFLCTNVECSVIDLSGKFDGTKLTEYWVRTLVDERKGTSQVATLLRKLKVATPARATHKELMDLFLKTLAGEPELVIETAWNADCQSCQETAKKKGEKTPKPFLVGMHRFPRNAKGEADPMVQCPACKTQVRAQARIVGFHELTAK